MTFRAPPWGWVVVGGTGGRYSLKKLLRGHGRAAVFGIDRIFVAEAIAHQFVPASRRERLQRADAVAPITAGSYKMGELVPVSYTHLTLPTNREV